MPTYNKGTLDAYRKIDSVVFSGTSGSLNLGDCFSSTSGSLASAVYFKLNITGSSYVIPVYAVS